jgi:integrase
MFLLVITYTCQVHKVPNNHSPQSSNPLHAVLKPKDENYRFDFVLCPAEARPLLRTVDRQSSLVGMRNYAILLAFLLSGLTEHELRHLRWSQAAAGSPAARKLYPMRFLSSTSSISMLPVSPACSCAVAKSVC